MSNADLSINITANTGAATANIDKLNKSLTNTDKAVKQITPGVNTAGQSLQNLGRIAQDAPFGFIGIQNNLNPLLESFQRLKTETGSTGSALKALGSSMLGAGGIGFALSVVSAGILFFQSGLLSFGGASKKAAAAAKEFADSLDDARASGIASGLQLQAYANIAADTTQSLETRNTALEKANKIMGDHGEKLTLVNVATKGAREEIEKFTQATIQQTLATKYADKAADLIIARAKAFKEFAQARAILDKVNNTQDINVSGSTGGVGTNVSTLGKLISAQSRYNEKLEAYQNITKGLGEVTNELNKSQEESARLFGEIGKKAPEKATAAVKNIKAKIEEEFKAEKLFLRPEMIEISSEQIKLDREKFEKAFQASLGNKSMKSKLQIEAGINFSNRETDKSINDMQDRFLELTDSIGQGLGNAISQGGNILAGVFDGVLHTMGKFLVELGKAAILTSKLFLAIKAAGKNPITGIVAGIAAVAAGYLLQSIKIPGFADGVTNFGGGLAMVGERGPELVRLPKGSDVIPNGRMNGMSAGGGTQVFIADNRLSGNDIVQSFKRTTKTLGRNG